ncbi:MAG: CDP-alcohol phosphatidyltransferase [Mucilaginibacter sp.]|nr:CDP-alcohol phosphatidyltransferase [Mucilaginibacter sp.]MDB5018621.1 CDP-alcohol phosphatidyltransferase [Mucilaginibacter sp.]
MGVHYYMETSRRNYYIVNGITVYRILAAPVLLLLVLSARYEAFKWMLLVSFFTDAVDGYLARRFKTVSVLGARLDSIGDDLTVSMAIIGIIKLNYDFIVNELIWIAVLLLLFLFQMIAAFTRYGKMTAFHTYIAKVAAVVQAAFLISFFFVAKPLYTLFYLTAFITCVDLLEEIVLVFILPVYRLNVKGLYWIIKENS